MTDFQKTNVGRKRSHAEAQRRRGKGRLCASAPLRETSFESGNGERDRRFLRIRNCATPLLILVLAAIPAWGRRGGEDQ